MRKFVGALSALGLLAAPVAASAGTRAGDVVPAAAKVQRSVQGVERANEAVGGSAIIIAIIAIAAVIAGIIAATDDNDSNG